MPQTDSKNNQGKDGAAQPDPKIKRRVRFRRFLYVGSIVLVVVGCIAGIGCLVVASRFFNEPADRAKFLTESILSLLVLVAIIIQTRIYFIQRDLMRKQWEEMRSQSGKMGEALMLGNRASVSVHSIAINKEKRAVLLKIENTGNTPAEEISIFLKLFSFAPARFLKYGEVRQKTKESSVTEDYGRTQLFKGNLPILLTFYLADWTDKQFRLITDGVDSLSILGYVSYRDGFSSQRQKRTEVVFDYHAELDAWTAGPPEHGDVLGWEEEYQGSEESC